MSHGVDPGRVRDLYRQMLRIRRFEERCVEL
jgi:TPP-dependent pyruvate/acetoin dehydrogenase alpha subunit